MAKKLGHTATAWIQAGTRCQISETSQKISYFVWIGKLSPNTEKKWPPEKLGHSAIAWIQAGMRYQKNSCPNTCNRKKNWPKKKLGHTATAWIQAGTRCPISVKKYLILDKSKHRKKMAKNLQLGYSLFKGNLKANERV